MAADLTHAEFSKHLNTKFRIKVNETENIEAELTGISEHLLSPRQERFAVVFRAPNETFLGQGQRAFEHDQMGNFELFLVPIGREEEGTLYEAVFNHLIN